MKKKIMIILSTVYVIAAVVISFINPEKASYWINVGNTVVAVLIAYFQILYSNSKVVFIWSNKVIAWFKHETVVWIGSYKFSFRVRQDYSFDEDVKGFIRRIGILYPEAKIESLKINSQSATFRFIHAGYPRNISLYLDYHDDENYQIRIKYESSLSYCDSKKEIKRFDDFLNEVSKGHEIIGSDTAKDKALLELYSVKISFSKFNPFYRLTVKNISKVKNISFNLSFKDGGAFIETTKNTLKASSKDKNELLSVLKDYVALSSIGD